MKAPDPFLIVRVHRLDIEPSLSGLCVGYEEGEWRASQFASHLIEWLPEFALTYSELESIHSGNLVDLLRQAAKKVYESKKFQSRGEFGELILHAAIRQVFNSVPAISKIYYKSARNDTVKGFDAVHVVQCNGGELELWLGEAKFYKDINQAIYDVIQELKDHSQRDYLRDEFLLISGKIDDEWESAKQLKQLIHRNTSMDVIFRAVRVPVLLTYDSECVKDFNECSDGYVQAFEAEINHHYENFASKELPEKVIIHLFLLPLKSKEKLVEELDRKLKAVHQI
ncbi:MAG: DUF1837 domain-containing protein [Methanobacteriota archaeon]|nr:MAG: DUF1837 domain-containing protein [Euryarchaeota archaeon]